MSQCQKGRKHSTDQPLLHNECLYDHEQRQYESHYKSGDRHNTTSLTTSPGTSIINWRKPCIHGRNGWTYWYTHNVAILFLYSYTSCQSHSITAIFNSTYLVKSKTSHLLKAYITEYESVTCA